VEDRAAVLRLRWDVIDAADVDLLGLLARQVLLQLRGVRERSKSEVNISGEGERELPPREVLGASIPQPLDELRRREKPLEVELEINLASGPDFSVVFVASAAAGLLVASFFEESFFPPFGI